MSQEKIVEEIQQLKKTLEEMEKRLAAGDVPLAVLEDFRMAVDHIRTTVWTLIANPASDEYEVTSNIARFRLKRATQMFRQILSDIDTNEVTVDMPELVEFHATLQEAVERVQRLYKSGA